MTREEAHNYMWYENDKNPSIRWGHHNTINNLHKTLIDQIYDDFEVTANIFLKANEEGISRHFNECEKYEAELKAKDEEITSLKTLIKDAFEQGS